MPGLVRQLYRSCLVRNLLALYGVRVVNQLLPLVVIPYLARVLEPEGWGLVAFAQAFAMYCIITIEYGFEYTGTRAIARDRDRPERIAELVAGIFGAQFLLACVVALAALLLQNLVPQFKDQPVLLWAGLVFAVLQGIAPLWYFTGTERIALFAAIDTGAKLIGTLVIFLLVKQPGDGWLVLAAAACASLVSTSVGYALVLRDLRPHGFGLALIGRTLRLGFSMFVMRIAVMMHSSGNTFLLGLLASAPQVAFFVAGEKLCRPAAWMLQPFNTVLLPRLSHLAAESPESARALAGISILLMGAIGVGGGLVIGAIAPWVVPLFYGAGYEPAVAIMQVMAMIVPLIVLNGALVSQWLIPHGLDRPLNMVIISAVALNLVLALLVAPRFAALGMAWVTVAVEGYVLIGLLWVLRRHGLQPFMPGLLRRGLAWIPRAASD